MFFFGTHHDVLRVEVEPGHVPVKRVQVRHPLGHVDGELQRAVRVHDEATAILLVKYLKPGKQYDQLRVILHLQCDTLGTVIRRA